MPPNLETDVKWRVWGESLKFLYPNLLKNLSKKMNNSDVKKEIGNMSVIAF